MGPTYYQRLQKFVSDTVYAISKGRTDELTRQPLVGKARHGSLRLGEMEVWALEGHGAAHTLREMLTIKSDDIVGRSQATHHMPTIYGDHTAGHELTCWTAQQKQRPVQILRLPKTLLSNA